MQDPRAAPPPQEESSTKKIQKRKIIRHPVPPGLLKTPPGILRPAVLNSSGKIQKAPKRSTKNDAIIPTPLPDGGTPDSLPDSGSSDDYRALRRKYLLLEEENFSLDKELNEAEGEVKTLEDQKSALLDHLVVLEGLLDPLQPLPQGRL